MNKLSEDHREILTLVCIKDMPYQDVADTLNIPVGTVRSRLSRARESLQVLGGRAYTGDNRVERIYREARIFVIGGGSEEILRDLAAKQMGF